MNYDKGEHLDWWQSLNATERFEFMKLNEVKRVTNKLIYRMFKSK
jgi:hypothetical protein